MTTHRTRIKICGITRIDNGLAAAEAGADAIGLVFWHGTPRRVEVHAAARIVAALPPFVSAVGLFVDPTEVEVRAVMEQVPLAALQFHGDEAPHFCRCFGLPYVKAIPVHRRATSSDLLEWAARYGDAAGWLFDAPPAAGLPGGTGECFDWSALPAVTPRPLVLSGGLHSGNVADALRRVHPWAVDVSSGVEAVGQDGKPVKGIKDPSRIAAFIQEIRNADG